MIYLDYNATTPVLPEIFKEMKKYFLYEYGNPGSRTHEFGVRANKAVSKARGQIANAINCQSNEVIFTSGATESNNLAILGLHEYADKKNKKHIVSSTIEHKSVLGPLYELTKRGYKIDLIPVNKNGRVKVEDILNKLTNKTLLVSIMHVNNETGVIQPINDIAEGLKNYPDVFFHTDSAQGFGKLNNQLRSKRIDFISISGHKIFASKGVGALITKKRNHDQIPLRPIMFGGGQEGGLRPGTLPVPLIVGLGKAAELSLRESNDWEKNNQNIRKKALDTLSVINYKINGDIEHTIPHVLNLSFSGIDSEALFVALKDVAAISNGSACTSSKYKRSHVLKAMGYSDKRIDSSIRISWGLTIDSVPWEEIIDRIKILK